MTRPGRQGAGEEIAAGRGDTRNLRLRIASAAVLAPLVLAAAYVGGWLFLTVCAIAAGGIWWEWGGLMAPARPGRLLIPGLGALLIGVILVGMNRPGAAVAALAFGAVATATATATGRQPYATTHPAIWAAGGMAYAAAALFGPALLRRDPELGLTAILFLAGTVWSTDILAYGFGRAIGGPLLSPQISPKKTWAGAVGGLAGGIVGGTLVAYASGIGNLAAVAVTALVLSILAQAGDLFESAVKRHFGAKDASGLIPGHGGLMDRLDGFLVAALAALVVGMLRHGTDAAAHGLLLW